MTSGKLNATDTSARAIRIRPDLDGCERISAMDIQTAAARTRGLRAREPQPTRRDPGQLGRRVRTGRRRCRMRCGDGAIDRDRGGGRRSGHRDRGRAKHRELGCNDDALGIVAGAHRWLRRCIDLVIRTVAVRRVGAAALLHDGHRAKLRHRNRERHDDRDRNGREPGRGTSDEHAVIRALPRQGVNGAEPCRSDTVHLSTVRVVDYDADSRIWPRRTIERRTRRSLM